MWVVVMLLWLETIRSVELTVWGVNEREILIYLSALVGILTPNSGLTVQYASHAVDYCINEKLKTRQNFLEMLMTLTMAENTVLILQQNITRTWEASISLISSKALFL